MKRIRQQMTKRQGRQSKVLPFVLPSLNISNSHKAAWRIRGWYWLILAGGC